MSDQDKRGATVAGTAIGASEQDPEIGAATDSGTAHRADEFARLRQQLADKEEEVKRYEERFLRERAELENFKKRTRREQGEALRYANESLIRELIPVVDNLERAVEHAVVGGNGAPLVEGVSLVLKSLHDVLKRHGVAAVEAPPGEPFDPTKHEAVARQEAEGEANRVVTQHERGYLLHDRLLRPAKVVVSYRKSTEPGVENTGNDD
jgi:molecular chaperone GrpE